MKVRSKETIVLTVWMMHPSAVKGYLKKHIIFVSKNLATREKFRGVRQKKFSLHIPQSSSGLLFVHY